LFPSAVRFPIGFFLRSALEVAPDLLGCSLVRRLPDGSQIAGVITETEAYLQDDPACHAFCGLTARNAAMFLAGGHAYVYFIYGMHFCVNVVTGPAGRGEAVLLRAVRVDGLLLARTTGPGRLCRALRIDRVQDGTDLTDPTGPLFLLPRPGPAPVFTTTPRVGIRKNADVPWRFIAGKTEEENARIRIPFPDAEPPVAEPCSATGRRKMKTQEFVSHRPTLSPPLPSHARLREDGR
jgi:DNA-3-methyladenine glycosylase